MVTQKLATILSKMYKISGKVTKFITDAMENWKVELTAKRKTLAEVKIQRAIFQGDMLLPLLFVIAMILLNHTLRKCTGATNLLNHKQELIS